MVPTQQPDFVEPAINYSDLFSWLAGNRPTGNGNSGNSGNGNTNGNGNGISISEKLGSLTPSPLTRGVEDVKSEPMELVCSNNNANTNVNDEHSNDSTGEHDANRSSSGDGGKGSLRYLPTHYTHFIYLT